MLAYMTLAAKIESKQDQSTEKTNNQVHSTSNTNSSQRNTEHHKEESKGHKVMHSLIEQCVKLYRKRRTHRNVSDFDGKYLKDSFMKKLLEEMSSFPKAEPGSTLNT